MQNLKEHVKRHAQRAANAGRHIHRKLKSPVHHTVAWVAVGLAGMASLIIISTGVDALAQTASSTGEATAPSMVQSQPLMEGQTQQGMQPPRDGNMPPTQWVQPTQPNQPIQPIAPCEPGKPCQPPPNFGSGGGQMGGPDQPMNQPGGFNNNQNQGQMGNSGGNQGQMGGPNGDHGQQMDQQRFEMMKKSLKQFTREVTRVKSQIASLQKKGVNVPAELSQAITQMDSVAEKIKNAQNADDIEGDMNDFQEAAGAIQEWMPKLGRMAQMPQMFKQADKEISKVEKAYASDAKRVKSAKMDLSDSLAEFRKAIDEQKAVLDQVKQLSNSDPEEAINNLQDDFFGNMDNMWEKERVIQMALNIKQGISQMSREMKDADKLIKKLKAKKLDTGELEQLLNQAKAGFEQVKALAAAKPIDPESLMAQIENMMDIKQEFGDKVQELTGDTGYAMPQQQGQNFQFNMPSGFMAPNQGPPNQGGGFGQPGQMMPPNKVKTSPGN